MSGIGLTSLCENYAKTLTESTFNFAITAEDIRGGKGNGLLGRYFHDSTLTATLTDAMFDLNYIALSLGVNVESGGLSVKEEELKVGVDNTVTTTETPVAFDGTMIGWYKKPTDTDWTIGTIAGNKMTWASFLASLAILFHCGLKSISRDNFRGIFQQFIASTG